MRDHRFRSGTPTSVTHYFSDTGPAGVASELVQTTSGTWQWNDYLVAGGEVIGMRVQHSTQGASTLYFHKDHLGSISTITNQNGAVVERLSSLVCTPLRRA